MVYGACWCPANQKDDLKKLGFDGKIFCIFLKKKNISIKFVFNFIHTYTRTHTYIYADSKVLKEEVRDKFFKAISGGETKDVKLGWRVHVSQPEELSNKMLRL